MAVAEYGEGGVGYVLLLLLLLCAFNVNVNVNVENMSMIYLLFAAACGRVATAPTPFTPPLLHHLMELKVGSAVFLCCCCCSGQLSGQSSVCQSQPNAASYANC